jgi:hypothetical protein
MSVIRKEYDEELDIEFISCSYHTPWTRTLMRDSKRCLVLMLIRSRKLTVMSIR